MQLQRIEGGIYFTSELCEYTNKIVYLIPYLIVFNTTLTAKRENRFTSVHEAVKNGDFQELEAMVKAGASVNEVDNTKDKFTPIHWACHKGALEVRNVSPKLSQVSFTDLLFLKNAGCVFVCI